MDIICLGELLIDMFPAEVGRKLTEVTAFRPKPGGAPANVAVAAKRLPPYMAEETRPATTVPVCLGGDRQWLPVERVTGPVDGSVVSLCEIR